MRTYCILIISKKYNIYNRGILPFAQGLLGVPTSKNPEVPNLVSVEAMQWVLLYLYIGHDKCY
jgi:hypothetical protein